MPPAGDLSRRTAGDAGVVLDHELSERGRVNRGRTRRRCWLVRGVRRTLSVRSFAERLFAGKCSVSTPLLHTKHPLLGRVSSPDEICARSDPTSDSTAPSY